MDLLLFGHGILVDKRSKRFMTFICPIIWCLINCLHLLCLLRYYTTHQYFLSKRSLYLVVWRISDGKKGLAELLQWLGNIQVEFYLKKKKKVYSNS